MHHLMLSSQCLVRDCNNQRDERTRTPTTMEKTSNRQNQAGVRQMLQRPGENQPWYPTRRAINPQRHDDLNADPRVRVRVAGAITVGLPVPLPISTPFF